MLIIEKMLVFLILMLVGLLLAKTSIIDSHTNRKLSAIVLYAANPAMIINSSQTEHTIPNAQLLTAAMIAIVLYVVLVTVAFVLPKTMKLQRSTAGAYSMMMMFSNVGFMGIPLVSEILGTSALLYVTLFILLFNFLMYTYGIFVLQRSAGNTATTAFTPIKLLNPGVISGVIAIALYLLNVQLPDVLTAPLGYIGGLTAPVSMLAIGAAMADVKIRELVTDVRLLAFSVFKLLVLPVALGLVLKLFLEPGDLLGVCIIMMSVPVGSLNVMMAQQYGGDTALLSKGVTLTTILCVATIPLVFAVLL